MPEEKFARKYTLGEVRAILDALSEGKHACPPGKKKLKKEAHTLMKHWAQNEDDLKGRVHGEGIYVNDHPHTATSFVTKEMAYQGVCDALNSADGQKALAKLDAPENKTDVQIKAKISNPQVKAIRLIRGNKNDHKDKSKPHVMQRDQVVTQVSVHCFVHTQTNGTKRLWIHTAYPGDMQADGHTKVALGDAFE